MFTRTTIIKLLFVSFSLISILGMVMAQEDTMIEPLNYSEAPVVLEFSTSAAGPPIIEPLTDGRMTFRINAAGEVNGPFSGNIMAQVSEVTANPSPASHPFTVTFVIETEQGTLEGYYVGNLHKPSDSDIADIRASGQILSVSGAYANLYLADVFVTSGVQYVDGRAVGDSGTMTIAAR